MSWPGQNWSDDASRNAEGCQQTTEAWKRHGSQEKVPPQVSWGNVALPTLQFQTSNL